MHQYFTDTELSTGMTWIPDARILHHMKDVLHMDNDTVRLVHEGKAWLGHVVQEGKQLSVIIDEEDRRYNELPYDLTLCIALVRREKFGLILQKAGELGASRIVPFVSSRCVVKEKKEKADRQKERWQSILLEASEQCKRNRVPSITDIVSIHDLKQYTADCNVVPYENAYGASPMLSTVLKKGSVSCAIGPEGGFSEEEIAELNAMGFQCVSLGRRILRAETACMYSLSVIGEWMEVHEDIHDR